MKPAFATIRATTLDDVATIVLSHRPLNVITLAMMDELLRALKASRAAKLLVLRGEGKGFSAGTDVREHLPRDARRMMRRFQALCEAFEAAPMPVLAYVHGYALGGGLELALTADILVAAPRSFVGQPEIALGVMAPVGAALLPSRVGSVRASDILLTGRRIPAEEAREWGLVNDVLDADAFARIVSILSAKSKPALRATKRAMLHGRHLPFPASLRANVKLYLGALMKAKDPVEGLKAFLEKRPPRFQDR
jgi:cyclohexa-1,5-dienecarbonyl-CoA hydratase